MKSTPKRNDFGQAPNKSQYLVLSQTNQGAKFYNRAAESKLAFYSVHLVYMSLLDLIDEVKVVIDR